MKNVGIFYDHWSILRPFVFIFFQLWYVCTRKKSGNPVNVSQVESPNINRSNGPVERNCQEAVFFLLRHVNKLVTFRFDS
jgi:hypothetical protein